MHGQDRNAGGLGIGLHLVKRIAELHGGHVGVNSTPGEGSAFWVRLPLALANPTDAVEDGAIGDSVVQWKVLILEE